MDTTQQKPISIIKLSEREIVIANSAGVTCAYCDFPPRVKDEDGTWYCSRRCAEICRGE